MCHQIAAYCFRQEGPFTFLVHHTGFQTLYNFLAVKFSGLSAGQNHINWTVLHNNHKNEQLQALLEKLYLWLEFSEDHWVGGNLVQLDNFQIMF